MAAAIFSGSTIKILKPILDLFGQAQILSGTVDPTSVATSAPKGSIYLNTSNGNTYKKTDSGSSTNWTIMANSGSWSVDTFSGTGSQTAFTLSSAPGSVNNMFVSINGVLQLRATYSVSSTTLTFTEAPPTGTNNIDVAYGASVTIGTPSAGSVGPSELAANSVTNVKIVSMDASKLTGSIPVGNLPTSNIFKTSSSGSFSTTSATYVDVTNLSQAITCSGTRSVELSLEASTTNSLIGSTASSTGKIAFLRNGSVLNEITSYTAGTYFPPCSIRFVDASPPAGSNTYKLQIKSSGGGTTSAQDVVLVVRET